MGWWPTLGAIFVFAAQLVQELGARGLPWLFFWKAMGCGVWFAVARAQNRRTPPVGFLLLLVLQCFGALYYVASFLPPPARLDTPFTAFDFHCHTTHSNGLLTPQQQINWHRARGFKGLAFTDSNWLMNEAEFTTLQSANPDMLLVNGSEYHGDAHLILLGLHSAISSRTVDVPAAVKQAKAQGALVIVAHPWYPARYKTSQLLALGVDGFEAWNGIIWSRELAELDRGQHLIGTTATDTYSKSGAQCYTWTLLPRGLHNSADVLRALRLHKTSAAFALSAHDTPQGYDDHQRKLRGPFGVFRALPVAWRELTRAQRLVAGLEILAWILLWYWWAAQPRGAGFSSSGPKRAVGFLRRRRFGPRTIGFVFMLAAWAGSIAAALLAFGALFKNAATASHFAQQPLNAILIWLMLDGLYLYGRHLWRRAL